MNVRPLSPLGARVTDFDIAWSDASVLPAVLAEHGVVVLPDQELDDTTFVSFLASFGQLTFTEGETPVAGSPDLNVISNVGRTTPPRSTFHVDTTYVPSPPAYTALLAVTVPEAGGQTVFSNQYAAYETLPTDVRDDLVGRTMTHRVTGVESDQDSSAEHPLLAVHPVSGRTALFVTAPARCAGISGMSETDAAEMIQYLVDHSTVESNLLRHVWSPGDVVMWDNRCVMHRADHDGVVGDRVMHRGMVVERTPLR